MAEPTPKPSHDPAITGLLERADSLRIPREELCKAGGETPTTVWRWQFVNIATWERREAFIKRATAFLDAEQARYAQL